TPPNFAVDWNGQYRIGERHIYFGNNNWKYTEDNKLVEEEHFFTDREPLEFPPASIKFDGLYYLYEREIIYRPDAKAFTEKGTPLTDEAWKFPRNVTKEDLLLHVPTEHKERLANLIDQRNQRLSAERSKTSSPKTAPAPLRPSKPYSRPSPQESVASGSSQIQRQKSRKTESPKKSRPQSRQQSPEPRKETPLPRRTPTPPPDPPNDPDTMSAAGNNNNNPKFTFPAPETFTGEKTRARSWITECETYFLQPGVVQGLPDDRTKIFFCLVKMSGKADFWKRVKLEEYSKEGGHWPAWAAFKTAFIEAFGGDDPKTKALTKLMTMERRRMKGFELYSHLTMLDNLFNESGMTQEDQKIIWLQKTIPNEYFKNIMFDDFDTYATLVTKLKKINKGVERKAFFNVAGIGGGTSSAKDEFAMDVDHLKIAITDVDSNMKDAPCFKCGRKGHWAKECFAKTKAGQGGFKSQGD
ncbi:hypothetical protein M378DRAFT_16709, partial [Amanita muscaria Koide BX008]